MIVDTSFFGEIDRVVVRVKAGGFYFWSKAAEMRAGTAADVKCGFDFSVGHELCGEIRSGFRAQQLSERIGHAPVASDVQFDVAHFFEQRFDVASGLELA